jgi:long-chain acyl-CoA synthetase
VNQLALSLKARVKHSPLAVVLEGTGGSLTAAQLLQRVGAVSRCIRETEAVTVALYADNSINWAVLDLACQFESICLVPIPTFFSDKQVTHLLRTAGVELLIGDPGRVKRITAPGERVEFKALPEFTAFRLRDVRAAQLPQGSNKITFTSGSTGDPKGVCLSFRQCLAVADSLSWAIQVEQPRHLCVLPLSTLLENIGGIYVPLLSNGCSLVLSPEQLGLGGSSQLNVPVFLQALHDYLPSTLILVPQLLAVLDAALAKGWQPPASLQFVAVGGARVAPDLLLRVRRAGLPVYEGYGLSECGSVVSLNSPGRDRLGSCGRVLPHVEVQERQGELLVSGNAFLGYLNHPDSWNQDVIHTGDLGSIDNQGFVSVAGRSKNVLISSFGRNISPEWVESELMAGGLFRQVLLVGESRPHCAALLLPIDPNETNAAIAEEIDAVCSRLPDYARPLQWLRLVEPFSEANGLLTENGRPRRAQIITAYGDDIEELYSKCEELCAV